MAVFFINKRVTGSARDITNLIICLDQYLDAV